jgi:hypothetical protein
MLPDASWIGPFANIHIAHAAYHAAVNPQDARAQPPDNSAGYDIDLDGLGGSDEGSDDLDGLGGSDEGSDDLDGGYVVLDNGGESYDRYTILSTLPMPGTNRHEYGGFSENPYHPQGFGQHGELTHAEFNAHAREHFKALGKQISVHALPADARKFAYDFIEADRGSRETDPNAGVDYAADNSAGYDIDLDGLRLGAVTGDDDDELTYADIEDQAASSASSSGRSSGSGEGVAAGCDGDPARFDGVSDEWYDLDNNLSPQDILDSANGRGEVSMGRYTIGDPKSTRDADYIWFQPPMCSGGDYDNCGYLCRSNYESLCAVCDSLTGAEDVCPDPWWMQLTGGPGGFGILIHAGRAPDDIAELLEGLARYPVLDEDHYDKLKDAGTEESWESWAWSDYKRALIKEWQMVHGVELDLDDVTDRDLRTAFEKAADLANEYWREDGNSMYIDVDKVAEVAVAHDIRPVGAVILDAVHANDASSSRPAAASQDIAPGQGTAYDIDLDGLHGLRGSTTKIINLLDWVGPPDCINLERKHIWYGLSWAWSPDYPTDIYAAVTVEQIGTAGLYEVTGWKHRDPQQPSAGFDTEMVEVASEACEEDVQELMGAYAARTGVIPTEAEAAELLIRRIATQGLEDLGAWRGHSRSVHTDTAYLTDLPDCHTTRRTAHVPQDDSAGYDISLDGLRGAYVAATRPPDVPALGALAILDVNAEYCVDVVHDTHLVLDDDMPPEEVEAREEAWRDGDYYCVQLIKRDVSPHMRVGTYCGVAGYGTAMRAGFAIFAREWAQYVPNADVDAFYARYEGAVGPDIYIGFYGQQQPTHWDHPILDPSRAANDPEDASDNSAGYDISLDGLRGSVASRHMIAAWANSLARASRYGSNAPQISEGSSKGTLLTWHRWNDRNGEWTDELSVDDLWGILRQYYNDEHGAEDSDDSAGYDIELDGLRGTGGSGAGKDSLAMLQAATDSEVSEFTKAFFETLLSTQTDDDGAIFDEGYRAYDIDKLSRDALKRECAAFVRRWHVEIARGGGFEAAGEDFAHVRNGDGGSFRNGGWVDGDALQEAAEEYSEAELYDNNTPRDAGAVLSVRNYERGAFFAFNGPRAIKVMLPDATWIGPYSSLVLAKAAYDAAVYGRSDPADTSTGYDIDLD